MKQKEENKCCLCGSTDVADTGYKLRDNKELKVLRCNNCSLVFLSSFEHIYKDFYKNGKMHSPNFKPERWLVASNTDDTRRFESLKNRIKGKSVLDFGCGAGGFLIKAKEIADVCGIEKQEALSEFFIKNNLNVYQSLESIDKKFDVTTMFHVLEHLREPKIIIEKLLKLLNEDGELIIEVPNEDDALLSLYRCRAFANFTHWSCHLFCFNKKTLKNLFNKCKVKINYIKPVQRFGLANHLYWIFKGEKGGHLKWTFFNKFDCIYKNLLKILGKSDTLMISLSNIKD